MYYKRSAKINKFRNLALILVFAGVAIMYLSLLSRPYPIISIILMVIGFILIIISSFVYLWVGMLSIKVVQVTCPNCGQPTKMLGRVDLCMRCNEPLTLDPELEGKPFDKKYNRNPYKSIKTKNHTKES